MALDSARAPRRYRPWLLSVGLAAAVCVAQVLGATLPELPADFRDSGPASFAPIVIIIAVVLGAMAGVVLGTIWWLVIRVADRLEQRRTIDSRPATIGAALVAGALAAAASGLIAPRLYTAFPLSNPVFDALSVGIVIATLTGWIRSFQVPAVPTPPEA